MKNNWIKIDFDNLPSEMLLADWKHPEFGAIRGSIVIYSPQPDNNYTESKWIFPEGGAQADIVLSEFTHYRKINP